MPQNDKTVTTPTAEPPEAVKTAEEIEEPVTVVDQMNQAIKAYYGHNAAEANEPGSQGEMSDQAKLGAEIRDAEVEIHDACSNYFRDGRTGGATTVFRNRRKAILAERAPDQPVDPIDLAKAITYARENAHDARSEDNPDNWNDINEILRIYPDATRDTEFVENLVKAIEESAKDGRSPVKLRGSVKVEILRKIIDSNRDNQEANLESSEVVINMVDGRETYDSIDAGMNEHGVPETVNSIVSQVGGRESYDEISASVNEAIRASTNRDIIADNIREVINDSMGESITQFRIDRPLTDEEIAVLTRLHPSVNAAIGRFLADRLHTDFEDASEDDRERYKQFILGYLTGVAEERSADDIMQKKALSAEIAQTLETIEGDTGTVSEYLFKLPADATPYQRAVVRFCRRDGTLEDALLDIHKDKLNLVKQKRAELEAQHLSAQKAAAHEADQAALKAAEAELASAQSDIPGKESAPEVESSEPHRKVPSREYLAHYGNGESNFTQGIRSYTGPTISESVIQQEIDRSSERGSRDDAAAPFFAMRARVLSRFLTERNDLTNDTEAWEKKSGGIGGFGSSWEVSQTRIQESTTRMVEIRGTENWEDNHDLVEEYIAINELVVWAGGVKKDRRGKIGKK